MAKKKEEVEEGQATEETVSDDELDKDLETDPLHTDKPEEEEEGIDDTDISDLEKEEADLKKQYDAQHKPVVKKPTAIGSGKEEAPKKASTTVLTKDDIVEKLSEELEQEQIHKDYKHLDVQIEEIDPNNYVVHVLHQSHGYINYLESKIMKIKGVSYAAYKVTSLDPPNINVILDGSKDIKTVLKEAAKQMRIELKGLGNAFSSVKI